MYEFENNLYQLGYSKIAGTDEVGRGPLAGPLVCAAVILDPDVTIYGLNDSKKLSEAKREKIAVEIKKYAVAYSIVYIYETEIDQINVYQASKKGMIEALGDLTVEPDFVLSDAMPLGDDIPHEAIIKGDTKSASIAAASIIAKVSRDHYMIKMAAKYPGYGFEQHKGYPTQQHIEALDKLGICKIHRKSYKPVKDRILNQMKLEI